MSAKRMRTPSNSSSSGSGSPGGHLTKSSRVMMTRTASGDDNNATTSHPLLCSLPPTCNPPKNRPTPIANTKELEAHYGKFHAHVCEERGCGCVFPEPRLLQLVSTFCIHISFVLFIPLVYSIKQSAMTR
jgi:hypothetical protein